jgi:hypothetical protein
MYILAYLISSMMIFNINGEFSDEYFKYFLPITNAWNNFKISN